MEAYRPHVGDWRDDEGVKQLLGYVMTEPARNRLLRIDTAVTAINTLVNTLEGLLLEETSLIISGRRSSDESFENARTLRDAVASRPVSPS
jgi:hypothetical protein